LIDSAPYSSGVSSAGLDILLSSKITGSGDFGGGADDLADDAVFLRFFRAHPVVTVRVLHDLVERLAGGVGEYPVEPLAHAQHLARLDVDFGGRTADAAARFMQQEAR